MTDRSALKDLYAPRFARWLMAAAVDWLIISLAYATVAHAHGPALVVAWVVASWVIGTRQHALGILGHDGAHGLVSRTRWLNDWATRWLCFSPLGVDLSAYWTFHSRHHRANGHDDDPEVIFKALEGKWSLPMSWRTLARYAALDLVGAGSPYAAGLAISLHPKDRTGWLALAGWWGVALSLVAWFGAWWIPGLWLFAYLTSFWAVFRLRMITEHLGTSGTHQIRPSWWQRAVFLPHNTWLHDVHHANPNVPCHQLEAAIAYYPDLADRKSVEHLLGELAR